MPNEQPDQLSIDDSGLRVPLAVSAMTRLLALLVALIPTAMLTLAEEQSRRNKSEEPDSIGVKSPILKLNFSNDRSVPEAPGDAVARLEKNWRKQKEMPKAWNASVKMGCFRKWKWSNAC
jgi:hypothetical protein